MTANINEIREKSVLYEDLFFGCTPLTNTCLSKLVSRRDVSIIHFPRGSSTPHEKNCFCHVTGSIREVRHYSNIIRKCAIYNVATHNSNALKYDSYRLLFFLVFDFEKLNSVAISCLLD